MRKDGPELQKTMRRLSGVLAVALGAYILYGLMTGSVSIGRHSAEGYDALKEPAWYGLAMAILIGACTYFALVALVYVVPKIEPHDLAQQQSGKRWNVTALGLIASAALAYGWLAERLERPITADTDSRFFGLAILAMLGLSALAAPLPPGRTRWGLRVAGAAMIAAAVLTVVRTNRWL